MKKFAMAAFGGTLAGIVATTYVAGPLLAQESARETTVYEQLDLFGDIFERIRSQYVEEVDEKEPPAAMQVMNEEERHAYLEASNGATRRSATSNRGVE